MKNTIKRITAATLALGFLASNFAMGGGIAYATGETGSMAGAGANISFNKTGDDVYYRSSWDNTAEDIVNSNRDHFTSIVNNYLQNFQSDYNNTKTIFDEAEQARYDADNTYEIKQYPTFEELYTVADYSGLFSATGGEYKYATIDSHMDTETWEQIYHMTATITPRVVDGMLFMTTNTSFDYTEYTIDEKETIDTVSVSVSAPVAGTTVGKVQKHNDEWDYDYFVQNPEPTITLGDSNKYGFEVKAYIINGQSDEWFEGTFEEGQDYYIEIALAPKAGYEFVDTEEDINLTVNGVEEWTLVSRGVYSILGVAKVKAVSSSSDEYTYIDGANQSYTSGTASFRINADYSLFEVGGSVYVDDELVDPENYTSESGSTIITFTEAYMSSLSAGSHTLRVVFNNGVSSTTKFTVVKTPNTGTAPALTGEGTIADNSIVSTVATIMVAMAGAFVVSKRFNSQEA